MPKKMVYIHLPLLIHTTRERLEITQHELGSKLGMTPVSAGQFISNMERGLCTMPIAYWKKLSKTLHIPLKDIIEAYLADERHKVERELEEY